MSRTNADEAGALLIRWPITKLIVGACLLVVTAIFTLVGLNIIHDHEKYLQSARVSAQNIVGVIAEYISQTVSSADSVLRDVANDFAANPEIPTRGMLDLRRELRQGLGLVPAAAGFFVLDKDGRLLLSTNDIENSDLRFSHREYFRALQASPERGLYIGPAVRDAVGPAIGQYVIHIARALHARDGSFQGVVAAAIRLEPLARVFDLLHLDPDDAVALYRDDGQLLLRKPFVEQYIGQNYAALALFQDLLPKMPAGTFVTASTIDGKERISAYQRIHDTSLVVFAGLSTDGVLEDWRSHSLSELMAAVILALFVCGISYIGYVVLQRWQSESQRHQIRMKNLSEGTTRLIQLKDIEALLNTAAPLARELTDAHQAVVSLTTDANFRQDIAAIDLSDRYAAWRNYRVATDGTGIYRVVCQNNMPMRLTQEELKQHPHWKGFGAERANHPPMRGWLAVPITGLGGRNLGVIQVSDRDQGDFTPEDQALLMQLSQLVSSCIQNIRLLAAVDNTRQQAERAAFEADQAKIEIEGHLRSMSDAYVILDRDFKLVAANPHAERILESDFATMKGQHFLQIRPDVGNTILWDEYQAAMRDRRPRDFRYHHKATDRWLEIRVFPNRVGIAIYFRDITHKHRVEEQLQQAQKMDAIGQLTGGVAHDFNNLLTVILGNTDILAEQEDATPYARRLAELAREAAAKAAELTNRLLAFSRRQQLSPEMIDLHLHISDTVPLLERLLGERIKISISSHEELWPVLVDPTQLATAVMNLCVNSRDAMPAGGTIAIRCWNQTIDAHTAAKTPELLAGDYACLSVSDTGEGMAAETIAKAFDPFFTTKEIGKGTGLGLSMVYGFLRQSRGHVSITSEPGRGTTVQLYFPRFFRETGGRTAITGATQDSRQIQILLVEDDELVRRHTKTILEDADYAVTETENADNAMKAFAKSQFDIVISDVILSGSINGDDLIRSIRRIRPEQKILLVSGYGDDAVHMQDTAFRDVQFLHKPFRKTDLVEKLKKLIKPS